VDVDGGHVPWRVRAVIDHLTETAAPSSGTEVEKFEARLSKSTARQAPFGFRVPTLARACY